MCLSTVYSVLSRVLWKKKKSQASRVELKLDLLALKMCTEWREGKKTIIGKGFLVEHSKLAINGSQPWEHNSVNARREVKTLNEVRWRGLIALRRCLKLPLSLYYNPSYMLYRSRWGVRQWFYVGSCMLASKCVPSNWNFKWVKIKPGRF